MAQELAALSESQQCRINHFIKELALWKFSMDRDLIYLIGKESFKFLPLMAKGDPILETKILNLIFRATFPVTNFCSRHDSVTSIPRSIKNIYIVLQYFPD